MGLGIMGTSAEAGLLHFRGAYHNPADVSTGDAAAGGRGLMTEPRSVAAARIGAGHAMVVLALRRDGLCGYGLVHALACRTQHGRLAQLAPEPP